MDTTRVNGTGPEHRADPLDVALAAASRWDELANDMLAQTEIKTGATWSSTSWSGGR